MHLPKGTSSHLYRTPSGEVFDYMSGATWYPDGSIGAGIPAGRRASIEPAMFFPVAFWRMSNGSVTGQTTAYYWTRRVSGGTLGSALNMFFSSSFAGTPGSSSFAVAGNVRCVRTPGVEINGVFWAESNVDAPKTLAANPQDPGRFYQWGINSSTSNDWSATTPGVGVAIPGWNNSDSRNQWLAGSTDPCPAGYRVPTQAELISLASTGNNFVNNWNGTGVNGMLFGTAPNQIFLPAAGFRNNTDGSLFNTVGNIDGTYWSNTFGSMVPNSAAVYTFLSIISQMAEMPRSTGFSVRCVAE